MLDLINTVHTLINSSSSSAPSFTSALQSALDLLLDSALFHESFLEGVISFLFLDQQVLLKGLLLDIASASITPASKNFKPSYHVKLLFAVREYLKCNQNSSDMFALGHLYKVEPSPAYSSLCTVIIICRYSFLPQVN